MSAGSAYDTHDDGLSHPKRVADREHDIAHLEWIGFIQQSGGEVREINTQDRQIGLWVGPDDFCGGGSSILQHHLNLVTAGNQVIVGEKIALVAQDDGGTQIRDSALGRVAECIAEKLPEDWVAIQRVACRHLFSAVDVDHGRSSSTHRLGVGDRANPKLGCG